MALDINGALRTRLKVATVYSNEVTLTSYTHFILNGSPTANFTINFAVPPEDGQHLILDNITNFIGVLPTANVPALTTIAFIYSNAEWKQIGSSQLIGNAGWNITGNAGTDTSVNFIGTTNNMPLAFRVNNQRAGYLSLDNTALGLASLKANKTGLNNVSVGLNALMSDTSGAYNTAIGSNAMALHKLGDNNVVLGAYALANNDNGINNVAIGAGAGNQHYAGSGNVFIGNNAGYYASGSNKLFINSRPLKSKNYTICNALSYQKI